MRIHELFTYDERLDDDLAAYIDLERIPPDLLVGLRRTMARQDIPVRDADLLQALYGHVDDDRRDRLELDLLALDLLLRRAEIEATLADATKARAESLYSTPKGATSRTRRLPG